MSILFSIGIFISIIYLILLSQYNLHDFNTIGKSDNWFLHPYNGGCCIFGQIMAFLTCFVLILILCTPFVNKYIIYFLYILSISWLLLPYCMNNEWLSLCSIPLAIIWISITFISPL